MVIEENVVSLLGKRVKYLYEAVKNQDKSEYDHWMKVARDLEKKLYNSER